MYSKMAGPFPLKDNQGVGVLRPNPLCVKCDIETERMMRMKKVTKKKVCAATHTHQKPTTQIIPCL